MTRRSGFAVRFLALSALCSLWLPGVALGICGKDPGDYNDVPIKMQTPSGAPRLGAIDVDDEVVIAAKPPVPGIVTKMEILLNGTPHELPDSAKSTVRLRIKQRPNSRQLTIGDIPIKSGATTLEVNVHDTAGHCGYGYVDLQVRAADQDFAIVIGVNATAASNTELLYARKDAYVIANYLIGDLKLNRQNIWLLTDDRNEAAQSVSGVRAQELTSPDVINKAFDDIGKKISYLSGLYLYFSGHQFVLDANGAGNPQFFFMLPNSDTEPTSTTRWSWNALVSALEGTLHLERGVVILDSCFSGGPAGAVAVFEDQPGQSTAGMKITNPVRSMHLRRASLPDTVGLLASSTRDQPSWELRTTRQQGAFTQSLLDVAANAKAARARLSLIDAVDGVERLGLDGAAKIAAAYVKKEYGDGAIQTPMHDRDTAWMREPGTWVP